MSEFRLDRVVSAAADIKESMPLPRVSVVKKPQATPRQGVLRRFGAIAAAAFLLVVVNHGPVDQRPTPAAYPMSGYFISSSATDSRNLQKLQEIQSVGGDTVITFGTTVIPASLDTIPADCIIEGDNCAKVAGAGLKVNRYFTFSDGSQWGPSSLKCPRDRHVVNRGKSYTVLVFPLQDEGCTAKDGGRYDVIVAGGSPTAAADPAVSVAAAASKLGMKFYAGMPAPAKRTDIEYLPDLSYEHTMERFTERFLQYQSAVNDVPGLAGFYHHIEMPVSDNPFFDPVLSLYKMQNEAIHRVLPTRAAIVSPYIEARRDMASITPENARKGARKIAQTAGGLHLSIAVQDGMGTGKGAAYRPSEASEAVDEFAASIVGNGSWERRYVAPNRDYFAAAARGVEGTGADLWANLEGMAPATEDNSCDKSLRGQTTIARIGKQLQEMSSATKVISYMWDPYYTCDGTSSPLKTQMTKGFTEPLVNDATFDAAAGELQVVGFNLGNSSLRVRWTGADGQEQQVTGRPSRVETGYGEQHGLNPRLEMVTLGMGDATLKPKEPYSLSMTNTWGTTDEVAFTAQG